MNLSKLQYKPLPDEYNHRIKSGWKIEPGMVLRTRILDRMTKPPTILEYGYEIVGHINQCLGTCDCCAIVLDEIDGWAWLPGFERNDETNQ
jgi:hypothetical protein